MVGILKALGAENVSIRKIFLYKAGNIIVKGMIWGNIIGLGFYFVQHYLRLIRLEAADYYVDFVTAYQDEGIPIWAISVQNEPQHASILLFYFALYQLKPCLNACPSQEKNNKLPDCRMLLGEAT